MSDAHSEKIDIHAAFPHQRKFHSHQYIHGPHGRRTFADLPEFLILPENDIAEKNKPSIKIAMATYNGHCHCGQTTWTAKLEKEQQGHVLCHCDTCKSLGGGAYSLNQIIPKSALNVTNGDLKTYTYYGESGKAVHCYYCPNCTTHAYHHQEVMGPDTIILRTVLLDGADEFKPAAEVFGKAKMAWEPEVATTFETMPPS